MLRDLRFLFHGKFYSFPLDSFRFWVPRRISEAHFVVFFSLHECNKVLR
jgi:hypothetical protein